VSVSSDDYTMSVLNVMIDERVEHVPVVDDGRLVGICTRTDLLKVRQNQREYDVPQGGIRFGALLQRLPHRNGSTQKSPPADPSGESGGAATPRGGR
jgi:predicted transcriptional regulator